MHPSFRWGTKFCPLADWRSGTWQTRRYMFDLTASRVPPKTNPIHLHGFLFVPSAVGRGEGPCRRGNEAGGRGDWHTRRPHLGRRKVLGQKTYRAIKWLCRKTNNRRKEGRLARSLDEADNLVQNGRRCQHGGIRLARCADRHHCHRGRVDRRSKRVEGVLNDRRIVGQHQLDLPPPISLSKARKPRALDICVGQSLALVVS